MFKYEKIKRIFQRDMQKKFIEIYVVSIQNTKIKYL